MALVLEFLLLLVSLAAFWIWKIRSYRKLLPPGEWGWPVVGYTKPSDENMGDTLRRLRKKHGDVFTLKMGSRVYVYLNDFKQMQQVLSKAETAVRPRFFSFVGFTRGKHIGLFNTSGEKWQTGRRFTMKNLKDLGLGKSSLEIGVEFEAKALVEDFKRHVGTPTEMPISMSIAILNVLWKMVSDKRFDLNDPMISKFQLMLIDIFVEFNGKGLALLDAYPILETLIPRIAYKILGVASYIEKSDKFLDYIDEVIAEHKATVDRANPRDFIDEFIIESEEKGPSEEVFNLENLSGIIADLFSAGSETTSSTIRWILFYMAKYPEVQAKVQQEIDSVVPRDRLPSMAEYDRLNYTEAVFNEVQRLVSITPTSFARTADKDIEINGYNIPKGTILMGNMEICHKDPKYFKRPNSFYPEHFLDDNGKFIRKREGFAPFSVGRRICPGESLAKLNVFLFGSALLQNFTFATPPGDEIDLNRTPDQTLIVMPKTVKLIINNRK